MRVSLPVLAGLLMFVAGLPCAAQQNRILAERGVPRDTLSAAELAYGLQRSGKRWEHDGTPRGDSLARLAETAYWDLEGGDTALGERMMRYAIRRGWRRPFFATEDLRIFVYCCSRDPEAWQALAEDLLASEPASELGARLQAAADSALAWRRRRSPDSPTPQSNDACS